MQLVARSKRVNTLSRFTDALFQIEGAYALVVLTNKKLIGARDPLGIRPLVIGRLDGAYILASETCALDIIGAKLCSRSGEWRDCRHHRRWAGEP